MSERDVVKVFDIHLGKPLGPDRLDYVSIVRVARDTDGDATYHLGSLSRFLPGDIGREEARRIIKEQGVELVER